MDSKEQNKQSRNRLIDTEKRLLPEGREIRGLGEKGKGIENYKLTLASVAQLVGSVSCRPRAQDWVAGLVPRWVHARGN